jgi:hypothetical protein
LLEVNVSYLRNRKLVLFFANKTAFQYIAWLNRNGTPTIIAIGAPQQWQSKLPLPSDATVTNLVDASISNPTLAAVFWPKFLHYLYRSSRGSFLGQVLLSLRFQKFRVQVAISDKESRAKVLAAIFKGGSSQFRHVDF